MEDHVCKQDKSCCCYILGTEPSENCPSHGWPWPPRCEECGKFLPWNLQQSQEAKIKT